MENKTNTKAIASLVLGILSLVFLFVIKEFGGLIGIVMAIIGLVLGIQAKKEVDASGEEGKGMAIAGLVCSIIALALCVLGVLCILICAGSLIGSMAVLG